MFILHHKYLQYTQWCIEKMTPGKACLTIRYLHWFYNSDFPLKNVICISYYWKVCIIQEATVQASILENLFAQYPSLNQSYNQDVLWSRKSGRVFQKKKKKGSLLLEKHQLPLSPTFPAATAFQIWKKLLARYSLQRHLAAKRRKYLQHQELHGRG